MDTLPSADSTSSRGQRVVTPAFGYGTPHLSARETLTLLNNALLSAHYGSVRLPVFVHHRLLSLDFPMRPASTGRSRVNPGSPNFRARCVPTCQGHRPRRTPVKLAFTLHRMLPSASCQGVGVLKLGVFRGSITWPIVPPVNASYPALRPCPHDSEPVWLAGPSPYDSFIRYILPACTVQSASCSLEGGCYCPQRTRCLRTGCWRCDTPPLKGNCSDTLVSG
jgi:hypothetical protein